MVNAKNKVTQQEHVFTNKEWDAMGNLQRRYKVIDSSDDKKKETVIPAEVIDMRKKKEEAVTEKTTVNPKQKNKNQNTAG